MYKKVFYNTASQIFGKAITASSTLIVTVIIGNALGEAGFGELTKIFVFVGYFYTLCDLGANSIYIKIATDSNTNSLLKALLAARLSLSLFFALIAGAIALLVPYDPQLQTGFSPLVKAGIIIYSLTIVTQALYTTANAYFQRNLRYDLSTIAVILGALTTLLGVIVVSLSQGSLLNYTAIYIFSGFVTAISAYLLIYKKEKLLILPSFNFSQMQTIFKSSWPIGLGLILNVVYFRIDVFILANFRSAAEVGVYGLAYQFFESSLAIPIFFSNALYPLLLKIFKENPRRFNKQVVTWLKLLTGISFVLMLALVIISGLIPVIYRGRFLESTLILRTLAIGLPFFFTSALLWHTLIIFGRQKLLIIIYLVGAIFNLSTNLYFVPIYGYIASAFITSASEALILALLAIAYLKSYNRQLTINN